MTMEGFANRIKIIHSIDGWEIKDQALKDNVQFSNERIAQFINSPMHAFLAMDDPHQRVIWAIIEIRHFAGAKYRRKVGFDRAHPED
jgi:hypothetical protein